MSSPLTKDDITSPTWLRLRAHYEAELAKLRVKNDAEHDPDQTARLRGRIAEIKNLLTLDQPDPAIVVNDD